MKEVACLLILIFYAFADDVDEVIPSPDGMQRIEANFTKESDYELLRPFQRDVNFDFLMYPRGPQNTADVYVAAKSLESFKNILGNRSIPFTILDEDVGATIRQLEEQPPTRRKRSVPYSLYDFQHYPTYKEIYSYLLHLESTHKGISLLSAGKSYEGREILCIRISDGIKFNRPILFIDAGIHAREWIAPTTALYAIQQFISDREQGRLSRDFDIYIIPLVNPDGYEYSRSSHEKRLWRKNRSKNPRSRCMGVDLNRNFDIDWNHSSQVFDACEEVYPGEVPFSEPETMALRDFIRNHKDRIKVHLTLHSAITAIMYPKSVPNGHHEDERLLYCLARNAASAITTYRGTRYWTGSIYDRVGSAAGSSVDWSMAHGGSQTAFAVELPSKVYGFFPPTKEIVPVGRETYQAFLTFARFVRDGLYTCRIPQAASPTFNRAPPKPAQAPRRPQKGLINALFDFLI